MLKLGTYGFMRFAMPLFPSGSHRCSSTMALLAVIGIIYGAYCAWVQPDVKKLVAYSSVSHLGFVMLGIYSLSSHGMTGSILQMINHGISTGALFLLVGVIYERRHTRLLADFGGLAKVMPNYALVFVIVTMSSIGLPTTNGFVGEFMILAGTFMSETLGSHGPIAATFAATGVILAAIYMLHAVLKMFWGPLTNPENRDLPDLSRRESLVLAPLLVLIFYIGLFPSHMLNDMKPSVDRFAQEYMAKLYAGDQHPETRGLLEASLSPNEVFKLVPDNALAAHTQLGANTVAVKEASR
jgi:NADH-quinone oxidoreductase subunit M